MASSARALLFDIDGVLIDSEESNMAAYRKILASCGYDVPIQRIKETMLGGTTHRILETLAPGSTPELRDKMVGMIVQNVPNTFLEFKKTATLDLVPELSDAYLIAAVTNRRKSAINVLNHFGVLGYFSAIKTADDYPPKPSPEMILGACAALGVKPAESVFFGDHLVDLEAGQKAGVKTHIIGAGCTRDELLSLLG
ncbi:MAG TPA: HAD-IA family hydrolase [Candidatus Micrarchaeota archaeon]|nr:HAD-IA family hydrolase [Candidatus Micrarchaeota archaeon]